MVWYRELSSLLLSFPQELRVSQPNSCGPPLPPLNTLGLPLWPPSLSLCRSDSRIGRKVGKWERVALDHRAIQGGSTAFDKEFNIYLRVCIFAALHSEGVPIFLSQNALSVHCPPTSSVYVLSGRTSHKMVGTIDLTSPRHVDSDK